MEISNEATKPVELTPEEQRQRLIALGLVAIYPIKEPSPYFVR